MAKFAASGKKTSKKDMDSKEPDGRLQDFLAGEVRYASLKKTFPEESARLSRQLEEEYTQRYEMLKRMAAVDVPEEEPAADAIVEGFLVRRIMSL